MYARAQAPAAARQSAGFGEHNFSHGPEKMPAPLSDASGNREREAEVERLHQLVGAAAELVFKHRLVIHRMNCGPVHSGKEHRPLSTSGSRGDACNAALQQLVDLEDNLSQETSRCIRSSNVTALHFLNEKQYSRALQILLRTEAMTQKGAGKWFSFFNPAESIELDVRDFVQSAEDRRGAEEACVQEMFVPFFTKRHEKMRQLAFAVINNNIGLYHFKLAEYELAVRRMSRALHLEEVLGVETIGVTYFNLAQAQYECGSLEEALIAISLAEEAIERRIYESETQMNNLRRIATHGGGGASVVPGLERRRLDVHIGWREGVCLLSRVLETHGRWLQSSTAYKAAIHCFEQSDRWLSSVQRLSAEENTWRQELRQRIQECKRARRHSCCFPKSDAPCSSAPPGGTAPPPRSIIVTTTLPRTIEIATCVTPFDNPRRGNEEEAQEGVAGVDPSHSQRRRRWQQQQQQQQKRQKGRRGKSAHRDVYELAAATPTAAAAGPRRRRSVPHRPAWDADTNAVHRDAARLRTATPATSSATHTNSEARTTSRVTSAAGTPLSRGPKKRRGTSARPTLSSEMELTASAVRKRQAPTPVAARAPPRRPHFARHDVPRRAWEANNGDELSSLTTSSASATKLCVPSLGRCIHVLQAFARARLSLLEKEWRRPPAGTGFVSPQSSSYFPSSSLSPSTSCGEEVFSTDGTRSRAKTGGSFLTNGGPSLKAASVYGTTPQNACVVLLAFLAARRSASLACQRRTEQRYNSLMERVLRQYTAAAAPPPATVMKQMLRDSARNRTWAEAQPQGTNGRHADPPPPPAASPPKWNGEAPHGGGESVASSEGNTCDAHLAEDRFRRRYNSLLRMLPRASEQASTSLDAATASNHFNGDSASVNTRSTGPHGYSSGSATPPMSEDSGSRNSGVEDFSTSSRRARRWSDLSSTPLSEAGSQQVNRRPRVDSQPHDENLGTASCGDVEVPTASAIGNGIHNGLPPRHPTIQRLPFSSWEDVNGIAYTTAGILRQRLLREEAAVMIQVAWRTWRERRRVETVRKLRYR
ncbi:uncharacterized protein Tco025E_02582 [Trypanosoma conorhini]|uniref:Uncharacterized protein n=1 Tax=Trypanosoma conorhini TaxID=83891 RepID=A0A422Q2V2_9TRYP|nr:uncharacterized protein Tco025E_02582 [Trypanosoma conorhini]RNF24293.1 hypothetical protein Tco025E_02582 [Trypanosoma conorhini]